MAEIELLPVVAVLEDIPQKGLVRGQVGAVVERLAPEVYEVEFSDDSGRTYASLALRADQLMRLHHEPSHQAAQKPRRSFDLDTDFLLDATMAGDDEGVVDIVSIEPSGSVVLTISDHLDWRDSISHQRVLQGKINRYLAFVESGEILDRYPQAAGRKVVIKVVMMHDPDVDGEHFFERARSALTQTGVQFRWNRFQPVRTS